MKSEAEKYLTGVGMADAKMMPDGSERNSMRMKGTWKEKWTELKTRLKGQKEESGRDKRKAKKGKANSFSRCIKKVINE